MSLQPNGAFDQNALINGIMGNQPMNMGFWGNLSSGLRNGFGNQGPLGNLLRDPNFAMALLANSRGQRFGQAVGNAALQAQQMQRQSQDDEVMRRYREAMIAKAQQPDRGSQPASVAEYEYAKQNGFKGSFQDWIVAGGQSSRPSAVQEWEFYSNLPNDQKRLYLEMKRNPNFQVKDVNQVPTVIAPSVVGGTTTTPLSTLPQVAQSAETVKQAEGRGGAVGKTQGEITGGILTKGSNAKSVLGMVDEAEKIIDKATGSAGGALIDTAAAAVGKSTEGAQNIARLKVLQAGLMLNMPRMEGPQSDRDVQLYREAAASLGEPNVPRETKKAALQTIRTLQERYKERASDAALGGGPGGLPFKIYPKGSADEGDAQAKHLKSLLDKYAPQ